MSPIVVRSMLAPASLQVPWPVSAATRDPKVPIRAPFAEQLAASLGVMVVRD
jgi:hypothetical protein